MATKSDKEPTDGVQGLIEELQQNEKSALDAVKRFVDTVNGSFPDLDDEPRQKIVDAAFKMTQQVVDASNQMATNAMDAIESALKRQSDSSD